MSLLLIFKCPVCGRDSGACPECVNTIAFDPKTGLPPDVAIIDGKATTITPTPDATARSSQLPVCDDCISAAIRQGADLMTAEDRHILNRCEAS